MFLLANQSVYELGYPKYLNRGKLSVLNGNLFHFQFASFDGASNDINIPNFIDTKPSRNRALRISHQKWSFTLKPFTPREHELNTIMCLRRHASEAPLNECKTIQTPEESFCLKQASQLFCVIKPQQEPRQIIKINSREWFSVVNCVWIAEHSTRSWIKQTFRHVKKPPW